MKALVAACSCRLYLRDFRITVSYPCGKPLYELRTYETASRPLHRYELMVRPAAPPSRPQASCLTPYPLSAESRTLIPIPFAERWTGVLDGLGPLAPSPSKSLPRPLPTPSQYPGLPKAAGGEREGGANRPGGPAVAPPGVDGVSLLSELSSFYGSDSDQANVSQPQAVGHNEDRAEGHRRSGQHRGQ